MFGQKLKKRIERLERLVDGTKENHHSDASLGLSWTEPAVIGLMDKVDAIGRHLNVSFEYHQEQLPGWSATSKTVAKSERTPDTNSSSKQRKRPNA